MHLYEIERASSSILEIADGKTFEDYERDWMLRGAIEREFMIIGEAMARLEHRHPDVAARITDRAAILKVRDALAYEHRGTNQPTVWGAVGASLPTLRREVEALMAEE